MTDSLVGTAAAAQSAAPTTQVYDIFIKASPEAIFEAITTPEFTRRYFHGAEIDISADAYRSHGPDGSDWGSGATLEFDPPRRVVHEWRSRYDPALAAEPRSRVTWEITPGKDGVTRLTAGEHRLEIRGHAVVVDGELRPLPPAPMAVLKRLADKPGHVVSRADLRTVLPGSVARDSAEHAVEMAITRLRRALGPGGIVETVVKRGYRLACLYETGL